MFPKSTVVLLIPARGITTFQDHSQALESYWRGCHPASTIPNNLAEMLYMPYSFFKALLLANLAAFFSLCISFFCLFDLGGAFCTFFCSLFATVQTLL